MNDIIFNTLAETVKGHGETIHQHEDRLTELKGTLDQQHDPAPQLEAIKKEVTALKESLRPLTQLETQVKQLSFDIRSHQAVLEKPLQKEVRHHFPKLLWITIGLVLVLGLCCGGWYVTHARLEDYQTNDLKYRFLKMTAPPSLLVYLYRVDSLERGPLPMRDTVRAWEEEERRTLELQRSLERNSTDSKTKQEELKKLERKKQRRSQ